MEPSRTYTYALCLRVFLDKHYECYRNIITINEMPEGALRQLVRRVQNPILSPFEIHDPCGNHTKCLWALFTIYNQHMTEKDIPHLISFLTNNGYIVDTKITKLMKEYQSAGDKLLFYITTSTANYN